MTPQLWNKMGHKVVEGGGAKRAVAFFPPMIFLGSDLP